MAALFGGSKASLKPEYTGLQLQTATATLPIPILWGRAKLAPNVVFYSNFRTQNVKSGGKGGLFSTSTTTGYRYSADVMLALCEGPITGVSYVWRDQSTDTLSSLGLTLFNGTTPQAAWSYLAATYPNQSLTYQGTAYVCAANYQLGGAASIGNHNFEIEGILAGGGVNGIDADPALVIYDFLTNAQYGAGFDPASINLTTLLGASGDGSLQTYCRAMGIAFSPLLSSPEQASSVLSRWLQLLNCAAVWSGGQLKFVPYGDQAIAAGNVVKTYTSPVPIPAQLSNGTRPTPMLTISTSTNFVADGGVVYALNSAALSYAGAIAPSAAGQYGIAPAGAYLFHPADQGSQVTITATVVNPAAYAPNLNAVYALSDLDFLDARGDKDPVQASRADPFSLPTVVRVECLSRNNQYGTTPVVARDQSQIEIYGPRAATSVQAHEICDELTVAPVVAQTILQRQLYVRTRFAFKLSWEYCLLDPMDIVTISDANLGLVNYPVRIVSVEEDEKGILTVKAEELVVGVSTPGVNPSNSAVSFQPNQSAAASAVNVPLIYEPPPSLTGNVAQVWVGASGGAGGVADPNWGGANVWASVDNSTYSQIGTITQALRQGVLSAPLGSAAGWDVVHTLAVNLAQSGASLSGTSAASAQAGATLSLVDGELLAYQTATLTGPFAYGLTGLQRGLGGSTSAAHATGAPFARLDAAVVQYTLPGTWVGVPLYFKFQSFNVFGAGVQDLATCAVYGFTPTGSGTIGPVTQALLLGTSLDFGGVLGPASQADDFGVGVLAAPVAFADLGAVAA